MADGGAVQIFQYNAFTDQAFAGNPAGVVLDASGLDADTMAHIARQMNLAETAFLVEPSRPDADIRLRWFTPAREVTLCGHATIAAFTAAAHQGLFTGDVSDERILRVETLSGLLRIRVTGGRHAPRVAMQIPVPEFAELDVDRGRFAELWDVDAGLLCGPWLRHRDLDYWYVGIRDREALARLRLDADALAKLDPDAAFTFFTEDTVDGDSDWHLRFFAPFHGVPEDIVTGSAQGPMGVIQLESEGGAKPDGWRKFRGEQGDILGRPGRVEVRVFVEDGTVKDVEIAGGAVRMLEGRIRI